MAKKKSNKQGSARKNQVATNNPATRGSSPAGDGLYAFRETIESIVIAFVLAFLFRTFEAEAFVIPTGSMSPSLQGRHKDVDCSECGYRFRVTASSEEDPNYPSGTRDTFAGICAMCRQTMVMRPDVPTGAPPFISLEEVEEQPSYPGDRILVNKYCYNDRDPDRWDVVVFKFPGNAEQNYIKRLVGLPNETLRIYQGDIFIRDDQQPEGEFQIERKPIEKIPYMLQPVHDTQYDPSTLYKAGWPLRWQATAEEGWQVEVTTSERNVAQTYRIQTSDTAADSSVAWLRYHHYVPQQDDWTVARSFQKTGEYAGLTQEEWSSSIRPTLIRDFNSYNTAFERFMGWSTKEVNLGANWVSDLALECEIDIQKATGELLLDLVEAGKHFTCKVDLQTGEAVVRVAGQEDSKPVDTPLKATGSYELRFANVDDQLILWVDDKVIPLSDSSPAYEYSAEDVFAGRKSAMPVTSETDLGDLAPAGIGARNADVKISRLQVLRDIYYIATKAPLQRTSDCPGFDSLGSELFANPSTWPRFARREEVDFPIRANQLFVMGDNSPSSSDSRLWTIPNRDNGSYPGGAYLDRQLLIGKAVYVFWPHSWGGVPGVKVFPGFPAVKDMRLIR